MTAEEWHALKVEKVIILQCFFRKILSKLKVEKLRETQQIRMAQQNKVFKTFNLILERAKEIKSD
jgi:hypothetical protein